MTILIISDIHYAGEEERARGDYELEAAGRVWTRFLVWAHRRYIWKRDPFAHNERLTRFLAEAGPADLVVANGDYSCDSAFIGVSDPAALSSARECIGLLRQRFGSALRLTLGDHELGKLSLAGRRGGLRLASWHAATAELGIPPLWRHDLDRHLLLGITSTLVALPVYEPETLPEELEGWRGLRTRHLAEINAVFDGLKPDQRVLLFCHDPSALPFLWRQPAIRAKGSQIELTVIGHLHSELVLRQSRILAGLPRLGFLGNAIRRMSDALREARDWRHFNVRLCPALSGIELLKDGGYARMEIDEDGPGRGAVRFQVFRSGGSMEDRPQGS